MTDAAQDGRLHRRRRMPRWSSGTAAGETDGEGYVYVTVDAAIIPPASVTDDAESTDPVDPADPNPPVEALSLVGWVAEGERVMTVSMPDGALYVTGSMGGTPHLIGQSTPIAGGTANVTTHTASSAEEAIAQFDCDTIVPHPRHSVTIKASFVLGATVGASAGVVNVYRVYVDDSGAEVETFVGRLFTDAVRSTANNGMTVCGEVMDLPDQGEYTYRVKIQVTSGFTIRQDLTADPLYVGWVKAIDEGPTLTTWPST